MCLNPLAAAWARVVGLVVLVAVAVLLGGCQTLSQARLLLPPAWSGMARVAPDLVLEAPITNAEAARARGLRDEALQRLAEALPHPQSTPQHWLCRTEACYQRLGGGAPRAKAFSDARILTSPRGNSAGLLAHEWWHAELYHRLGWWQIRKLPRWFDEGVAVWVSQEPKYSEAMYERVLAAGVVPPALPTLVSFEDWTLAIGRYGDHLKASEPDALNVVYPTAGHEVRRWIDLVGLAGLHQLVADLAAGADFHTRYADIEREATGSR